MNRLHKELIWETRGHFRVNGGAHLNMNIRMELESHLEPSEVVLRPVLSVAVFSQDRVRVLDRLHEVLSRYNTPTEPDSEPHADMAVQVDLDPWTSGGVLWGHITEALREIEFDVVDHEWSENGELTREVINRFFRDVVHVMMLAHALPMVPVMDVMEFNRYDKKIPDISFLDVWDALYGLMGWRSDWPEEFRTMLEALTQVERVRGSWELPT